MYDYDCLGLSYVSPIRRYDDTTSLRIVST